jgi:hypothetical protein
MTTVRSEKGRHMKAVSSCLLAFGFILILSSSCAVLPKGIFSTGEVRLLSLNVPGTMQEDLPYDVVVTFREKGDARIRNACFRWLDDAALVRKPSLYCYTAEVASNERIGSVCWRFLADGDYTHASPTFCTEVTDIVYEDPGRFIVRLSSRDVKPHYNALEGFVEYVADGALKQSNRVSTKIIVQE